ncbi:hypothetical protein L3X38_031968 [Prunus dulcis]|uniref:DNAse I-like superfamily protein n=1 Tax=Prunus dulcis TaxID=3755 RepID=A0AAD4YVG8_PRUDU|nr:hypothetical protein L3X38_031968 [Prunus dulcis]
MFASHNISSHKFLSSSPKNTIPSRNYSFSLRKNVQTSALRDETYFGVNLQDEEVLFGDGYDHAQERGVFCFKNKPPNIDEGTKGLRAGLHVDNPQTSYVPESPNAGAGSPVKLEKTIWILSFLTPLSKGAGGDQFSGTINNLKNLHHFDFLAVLEPRISGVRAANVIKKLNFERKEVVEASGKRDCSWRHLTDVGAAHNLPWTIIGDFNETVCSDERKGGSDRWKPGGLANWIQVHKLVDLGFIGSPYTWTDKRDNGKTIWRRIDRGICNTSWRIAFSEAFIKHLPRINSDHNPLLLSLDSLHIPGSHVKPFRFEAMWLKHDRRRRNKLEGLENEVGQWIDSKEDMKEIVIRYFENIFSAKPCRANLNIQYGFPHIQQRVLENLNSRVSVLEIQNSLFAIGSVNAPGPDGIPANFFQHAWDICGRDLVCLVQYCFNCGNILEGLNNKLIALIPKVDKPSSMKQLRPISLCNTICKVHFKDYCFQITISHEQVGVSHSSELCTAETDGG